MYTYLIRGAQVVDGAGSPAFFADVAVEAGRIAAVGDLSPASAKQVVEARGRVLTPGFLDIHRHADAAVFRPGFGELELRQGLTTIVSGNCGLSLAPVSGPWKTKILHYLSPITGQADSKIPIETMEGYLEAVRESAPPLHTGELVGMGTLRAAAAGYDIQRLEDSHYTAIHRSLEQALAGGALGVSLGLGYAPECFYTTQELLRALAPLRDSGVPVTVHMRQEGAGVVEALREMISVARELRTPVEISHLKCIGTAYWQKYVPEMLRLLGEAREAGLDIACDLYPYTAGSTQLLHILPPEAQTGGTETLTRRLRDQDFRRLLRRRMETGMDFENISALVGFENIVVSTAAIGAGHALEGLSIAQIAARESKDCFTALFDLLEQERCEVTMIDFIADEADIASILQCPFSSLISDSTYPTEGRRHPRVRGAAVRLIETYVREKGVLSLPQAIRKLTSLPASRLGLTGKGRIAPGMDADLCLFDPGRLHAAATYQEPERNAAGMDWVFVDGIPAIEEGRLTGSRSGRVLRRC